MSAGTCKCGWVAPEIEVSVIAGHDPALPPPDHIIVRFVITCPKCNAKLPGMIESRGPRPVKSTDAPS